jgi:hypothetical protein
MTGCGYGKNKPVEGLHQRINGGYLCCRCGVGAGSRVADAGRGRPASGGSEEVEAGTDGGAARYASAGREAGGAGAGSRGADTGGGRPTSGGSKEVEDGNVRCRCNAVRARKQMGRVREAGRGSGQRSSGRQPERGSQRAVGARRWQRGDETAALGCEAGAGQEAGGAGTVRNGEKRSVGLEYQTGTNWGAPPF